ncbi:ExbD/TolR family protein [Carboxylicivirga caseinilyticus]|uniref:ExbD/TolR family protein n=1 Tax=Carboxylicivirga caseinilyticus TaxID=3417572 RepID=UPI003D357F9B|nr:biopolymer transporter ExbD [Marinilabiliaceae bacterium A049]
MKTRETQEVNAGSMADIAFLLLIFFLVATTMDTDTGIGTLLPPYQEEPDPTNQAKNDRNVFEVLVNADNQLMVEKQLMDISQLTEATKKFILNHENDPKLSEKETKTIAFFGPSEVSKGVISLQTANDTQYQTYLTVQNEILRAFNELRNDLAKNKFGKEYQKLKKEEKDAVREMYPKLISEAEPVRLSTK